MSQTIYQVDSFTSKPFGGNPAGVCILAHAKPDEWMQAVAAEMNVAETAFLTGEGARWHLRWFTPAIEVDLCGHATLAAAHTLWESGTVQRGVALEFSTRSGILRARQEGDRIALDFPLERAEEVSEDEIRAVMSAYDVRWMGRNRMDVLVEVGSAAEVRERTPDFARLNALRARGIIITAQSDDGRYDFVSRFFAPAVGIDEDPVTGSAHCALAPYWMKRLGKTEMVGFQASRRGGVVGVRVEGDRVHLLGNAVTVLKAELFA